jgi:molybdenum cofactor biosynthesis enzyme MoaA
MNRHSSRESDRSRAPGCRTDHQPGTGHVSPGMNTKFCAHCLTNRPTLGGRMLPGGLQRCALHVKAARE